MEPVTHILTGACLARSGLNRKAAYTTLAMAVAAEFPDIDTLWSLNGPVTGFTHHRGITHTFTAIPLEAAFLLALVWALHRWRLSRAKHRGANLNTKAPIRWITLYGLIVLALLSHLALDFTNNYGIRPFFPFNPRWYAGSFVFIFDPTLFAVLLLALGLPSLFRLIRSEVGERPTSFNGRIFALTALALIATYYTVRAYEHSQAVTLAMAQSLELPAPPSPTPADLDTPLPSPSPPQILTAQRALANPDPLSIFRWYTVTDFGPAYQLATADTRRSLIEPTTGTTPKPDFTDPTLRAAAASPLGRAYLDWSPMPFVDASSPAPGTDQTTVVFFRDPRFMGDTPLLHSSTRTPLTGAVELDAHNNIVTQSLDGKLQQ
jgi:inner membrane protein